MDKVTTAELKLLARKYLPVKEAGYGELIVKVQNGKIVYITVSIGEQIPMDLDN